MRKLIVTNIVSLDGYYEGPGKNVMALFDYRREAYQSDESFDSYNCERLRAASTLLLGRSSFEGFKGYWPRVADDPNAPPIQREISRLNNAIDKVVVSDSLTPAEIAPWNNTRIIRRTDAYDQIAELKRQPGQDILVFGSRMLWNDLLAHNLVDELHLILAPVVIGAGTPLFNDPLTLQLIGIRTWDGSGNVLVQYGKAHMPHSSG
ncbi:MAG TPA: dihydrofolate reductase family protein [Aggregatilineaceae bacterium]|nr:dihydrofolate reductase family protein [Aggregatilineaceae bacterium]